MRCLLSVAAIMHESKHCLQKVVGLESIPSAYYAKGRAVLEHVC